MTTDTGLSDAQEDAGMDYARKLVGSEEFARRIVQGLNGEYYLEVHDEEFVPLAGSLAKRKCVLIGLFCTEGFSPSARFSLFSVFEKKSAVLVVIRHTGGRLPLLPGRSRLHHGLSASAGTGMAWSSRMHSIPVGSSCTRTIPTDSTRSKNPSVTGQCRRYLSGCRG